MTDPQAIDNARKKWPDLVFAEVTEDAIREADAVLVLTEWPKYTNLDPRSLRTYMAEPRILDGRNCLDPVAWRTAGWQYRALGRP